MDNFTGIQTRTKILIFKLNLDLGCEDDSFWKDSRHGDGKARCIDLTLDYCNNRERWGDDYTEEARRNCPKSCGLC